ncbi:CARDB domain-containing protein [Haloglomus halophilum]|uniref:CARDB domain-containing protein n=1 Tax=Haloglomus halophilum TaxID=2962672 RepID=UPI0020C9DF91|nr:CARDB domain-containing protein [Haloglomus halophilum]
MNTSSTDGPTAPRGGERSGQRLRQALAVLVTLLVVTSGFVAFVAAPVAAQTGPDVLGGQTVEGALRITVDQGNLAVARYQSSSWVRQYYSDDSSDTVLYAGGTVYDIPGGGTADADGIELTVAEQSMSGDTIVTRFEPAGSTGIQLVQRVSYTGTQQFFDLTWEVENTGSSTATGLRLLNGKDTYLAGGDNGEGFWNPGIATIGVAKEVGNERQQLTMSGLPGSEPFNHQSNSYSSVQDSLEAGALTGIVDTSNHDNGYALEWRRSSLAAGDTWTVRAREGFAKSSVIVDSPGAVSSSGDPVNLQFDVTNVGDTQTAVSFATDGPSGWTVSTPGGIDLDGGATEPVTVTATPPESVGSGSYDITLTADTETSTFSAVARVDIAADGESRQVRRPARFSVIDSSISPDEVEIGENITVTVTVENSGDRAGTYIGLLSADNRLIETQMPRVAPDETATLTYEFALNRPGGYYIQSRAHVLGRVTVTPLREPSATVETDRQRPNRVEAALRDPQPGRPVFVAFPFTNTSDESGVHLDSLNVTVDRRTDTVVTVEQSGRPQNDEPPVAGGTREFSFFTIDVESAGNVTDAGFTFTIQKRLYKEFIDETDPAAGTALFRYDPESGTWERFEMELIGETDNAYRFRGSTPGFSTFAVGAAGTEFDLRDVRLASETITAGDDARIRATVANDGDRNGTYTAVLRVDGDRRTSRDVFVPAGESRNVQFRETFQEPGEYAITLDNVSAGTLTVEAAATPTPEPTPTPTEEPEPTDTPTESGSSTPTETDDGTPATTASDGQPGFALVTALLALLGAALLSARRRD